MALTFQPPTTSLSPSIGTTAGTTTSGIPTIKPSKAPVSAVTSKPVPTFGSAAATTPTLANYVKPPTIQTATGATIATNGQGSTNSPTNFSIDTSNVGSNALAGGFSTGDVQNQRKTYADYVNGLAQAQQYSPEYIAALQQKQQADANAAKIQSNFYTGNPNLGDTVDYAQGETAKALQLNSLQQLNATQQMDVQSLLRQGNIASAQTQLQYSPEAMSGSGAIQAFNTLATQFGGTNPPQYDPTLSPQQNLTNIQQHISQSAAYQAGFQSTYTTPGGGTNIYNKLNTAGLQQNSDGSITLVPAAAAALGTAQAGVVNTQLTNLSNINGAIEASGKTISTMTQFMNQYGLNQSNIPIANQIQNSVNKNLDKAGAIAALNVDLDTLRKDYTQFLIGRGGSVAGSNEEADKAIPANISPSQLNTLYSQMKQDGINTASAISSQVNQALSGITNNTVGSTSTGASGSIGSSWDNL